MIPMYYHRMVNSLCLYSTSLRQEVKQAKSSLQGGDLNALLGLFDNDVIPKMARVEIRKDAQARP